MRFEIKIDGHGAYFYDNRERRVMSYPDIIEILNAANEFSESVIIAQSAKGGYTSFVNFLDAMQDEREDCTELLGILAKKYNDSGE